MLLELDGLGPRYQQITRALRSAIREGRLAPGARVAATRELATALACSRNVVLLAYDQLLAEGYLVAREKAGTFVSAQLPAATAAGPGRSSAACARIRVPPRGRHLVQVADAARAVEQRPRECPIDFVYGLCEPDRRVVDRLKQGFTRALRHPASFLYGHPAGDRGLRSEVAQRLHAARGIPCTPEQIVITSGAQQALDLCARLLVTPGDAVVVEDPGYEAARAAFEAAGATIVPGPVDHEGLDPARLPATRRRVRLMYVTPSHQFPTGAILTAPRRHALLAWARAHGACVLEDDYDGELRYRGQPIKALAAMDTQGAVIYCGTFAKALYPAVRLGYLLLPASLADGAASVKWLLDRGSPLPIQRMVAALMGSGDYDRHIRRMQRRYAARRDRLTRTLRDELGPAVEIGGDGAGLHLVAWLPGLDAPEIEALVSACRDRGVGVYSVARHALKPLARGGLILGYGLLDEAAIEAGVRRLAAAYRHVVAGRLPAGRRRR
jgi:GntR family transcriptional regulator/MocR family aminotransferase